MSTSKLLAGKACVISGVGPGLGRELALAFAGHGADVVLGARSAGRLQEVAAEVEGLGRRAVPVVADISDPDACRRLVRATVDELGRLDVLVHNAVMHDPRELFEDADLDTWRALIDTNVLGTLRLTDAAIPVMKDAGRGSIVFVSSMIVRKPVARQGGYAASKGALLTAAQVLAKELGPHGIRVNTVVPGWMWGPSVERYFEMRARRDGTTVEAQREAVTTQIALGRIPTDDECADAVVFFASDLSCVVTGQSLDVNGGEVFH